MHRVRAGDFAGREQRGNVEIAFARGRRADADALIRELHVHRFGVGGGVDRDGGDTEFLARAQHAQRNLAAVCNQDFIEHRVPRSLDDDQRLAEFDRHTVFDQYMRDFARLRCGDRVHGLHGFDDEERLPDLYSVADIAERACPRFRRTVGGADHRRRHGARVIVEVDFGRFDGGSRSGRAVLWRRVRLEPLQRLQQQHSQQRQ